ncbi:MAG: hypothetical protein H0X33_00015 [Taibaiella sp.]|nr:hypothetical protein [Taibaiella sp.]
MASCKKDNGAPCCTLPSTDSANVYVVCEGNLGNGDGSLYLYRPKKDSTYGDVYNIANKKILGDVFQSMTRIGDNLFLCVNNSDKVVVINANNWQEVSTINIPKPRYILQVSSTKAYVSTLFSEKIYVINPQTFSITGSISLPYQNPEKLLLHKNVAYACTWDTACNHLYTIDINTDKVTDSIQLTGKAPQEILLDKEQKLWILSGNAPEGKVATIDRYDPDAKKMLASYAFSPSADPLRPVFNNTADTMYFIEANYNGGIENNGIYRMGIKEASLPATPFIAAHAFQYFWALGIDPVTGYIYVGDPKGFTQKGSVTIYRPDATTITHFASGIGPGHFYFDEHK